MKTKDNVEIKVGQKLFDRWGEPATVTGEGFNGKSVYTLGGVDGKEVRNVCPDSLYASERLARESWVAYLAKKAWDLEQEAKHYREMEHKNRLRIKELEEQEANERRAEEIAEEIENSIGDDNA